MTESRDVRPRAQAPRGYTARIDNLTGVILAAAYAKDAFAQDATLASFLTAITDAIGMTGEGDSFSFSADNAMFKDLFDGIRLRFRLAYGVKCSVHFASRVAMHRDWYASHKWPAEAPRNAEWHTPPSRNGGRVSVYDLIALCMALVYNERFPSDTTCIEGDEE